MKIHTPNYQNTFIQVAEDCPVTRREIPPAKGQAKTVAGIQFDLVSKNPYAFTSDEVFFKIFVERTIFESQNRPPTIKKETALF